MYTGRLGAIQMEITIREELYKSAGIELTNELKQRIRDIVNNMEWKEGGYKISTENGIQYIGDE